MWIVRHLQRRRFFTNSWGFTLRYYVRPRWGQFTSFEPASQHLALTKLMPSIFIKGQKYSYSEAEIINFGEGLIGLPNIKKAVLVPLPDCEPFFWLASMNDEKFRFVVVNPNEIFPEYNPSEFVVLNELETKVLSIVKVSSDWQKTTINLRAPILINSESNRGVQMVLTDSNYKLAENLPQN